MNQGNTHKFFEQSQWKRYSSFWLSAEICSIIISKAPVDSIIMQIRRRGNDEADNGDETRDDVVVFILTKML